MSGYTPNFDRALKIFTRFRQFWEEHGIHSHKDPAFKWIIYNNPDEILFSHPWDAKLKQDVRVEKLIVELHLGEEENVKGS